MNSQNVFDVSSTSTHTNTTILKKIPDKFPYPGYFFKMVDQSWSFTTETSSLYIVIDSAITLKFPFQVKEVLIQKYSIEGKSARQVAIELNCSHDAINRALKRYDLIEKRTTGKTPYGWKLQSGVRIPASNEQAVIERIVKFKAKKWSNGKIAVELTRLGHSSPSGKSTWSSCTIRMILLAAKRKV